VARGNHSQRFRISLKGAVTWEFYQAIMWWNSKKFENKQALVPVERLGLRMPHLSMWPICQAPRVYPYPWQNPSTYLLFRETNFKEGTDLSCWNERSFIFLAWPLDSELINCTICDNRKRDHALKLREIYQWAGRKTTENKRHTCRVYTPTASAHRQYHGAFYGDAWCPLSRCRSSMHVPVCSR